MALIRQAVKWYALGESPAERAVPLILHPYEFLLMCEQQGVVGPVVSYLEQFAPQSELVADLQARREATALLNLTLKCELQRVTLALSERGIDFLVLKGIPLAERLYTSLADRPCADIDLLFRLGDFYQVLETLQQIGFSSNLLDPTRLYRLARAAEGIGVASVDGVTLDLHFGAPYYFNFAPLLSLAGRTSQSAALDDYELFFLLCDHGTKHMWSRIIWLLDLALLLKTSGELEPEKLASAFHAAKCGRSLNFALSLLSEYEILHEPYLTFVSGKSFDAAVSFVVSRQSRLVNSPEIFPRDLLLHLEVIEGFSRKAQYLIGRLLHPTARDLEGTQGKLPTSWFLCVRFANLIINRIRRFIIPLRKWLPFTASTTGFSKAKYP